MRWFLFWMPLVEEKKSGLLAAAYLWLRIKEEWNSCIAFVRCALFLLLFLPNLNSLNGSVSTFNGIQNDLYTNKKHKTTSFGSMCQHCNTWKTTLSDLFSGPRKKCENNWVIIVNSYEKKPSSDLNLDHALAHFMKIKIHFCMHSEQERTHTRTVHVLKGNYFGNCMEKNRLWMFLKYILSFKSMFTSLRWVHSCSHVWAVNLHISNAQQYQSFDVVTSNMLVWFLLPARLHNQQFKNKKKWRKMQWIGRKQRAITNSREEEKNWLKHATMKTNRTKGKKYGKESLFVKKADTGVYDYYEYTK